MKTIENKERLQKIIARAGITSRRKAELLIEQGKIKVNGVVIKNLGSKADPRNDKIEVDGKIISIHEDRVYILLNKPKGYVTTLHDPEGRPTVAHLVRAIPQRLFPVGRLDFDTEGLLLLTNDGDFAQTLQHPSHGAARTYLVKVKGYPSDEILKKLKHGIYIDGSKTGKSQIKFLRRLDKNTWLQLTIWEGKNRQIKKMFSAINHPAMRIIRIGFGPLHLNRTLKPGDYRHLTKQELKLLKLTPTSFPC